MEEKKRRGWGGVEENTAKSTLAFLKLNKYSIQNTRNRLTFCTTAIELEIFVCFSVCVCNTEDTVDTGNDAMPIRNG